MNETEKKLTNTETIAPKKRTTQDEAIAVAMRNRKTFKLMRSIYQKSNGKNYYAYSVFLILDGNRQSFVEASLVPYIGFVKSEDNLGRTSRNASSYSLLNFLYDNGQGLLLEIRKRPSNDVNARDAYDFYAVAEDESGIVVDTQLVPKTPGAEGYLKAAFAGFGNVRDFKTEDFETIPGLKEAFERILEPGVVPNVTVEDV